MPFEQVVDPARREQLNMLEIQNVGEYRNQIKIKLTDKLNIFSSSTRYLDEHGGCSK